MLLPDEIAAKSSIPALRAMVASKMIKSHRMTQQEAARRLHLTQAAISNYVRKARGGTFNLENVVEVQDITTEIASMLAKGEVKPELILRKFEEANRFVKVNRLLCDFHMQLEPDIDLADCDACNSEELVQIQ